MNAGLSMILVNIFINYEVGVCASARECVYNCISVCVRGG